MKAFGLKIQMHKHNYWEHRGFTTEEHKLIRKRKLHENSRNSTELKCQSASPQIAPTKWAFLSQKLERRTEWGRWTDPRRNISTVWHWQWVMTWIQLSSSTTEVEKVPASAPWSCRRHFCNAGTSPGMMGPLWLLIFKGEMESGRDLKHAARFMRKLKNLF